MNFYDRLNESIDLNSSLLCVGLDTDMNKIPQHIKVKKNPLFEFNKAIIDATSDVVSTYKPNSAFYEALGTEGIKQLKLTCLYIKEVNPKLLIILDAKRADIGNTNDKYVEFAFDYLGVDAITLHPYLGSEGISPFLKRKDKGSIILCRTSNPGAKELQDQEVSGRPLYQFLAEQIATKWNQNKNCMMVVGATYPEEIRKVREIASDVPFLIPGIGAQGGDLEASVRAGLMRNKKGVIISASRSVLYASKGEDFAKAAKKEAELLRGAIESARSK